MKPKDCFDDNDEYLTPDWYADFISGDIEIKPQDEAEENWLSGWLDSQIITKPYDFNQNMNERSG